MDLLAMCMSALGKNKYNATHNNSYTKTVNSVTRREQWLGHKVHRDNFLPSPDLYDSYIAAINCCGIVKVIKVYWKHWQSPPPTKKN
jgi:hypothetical protein